MLAHVKRFIKYFYWSLRVTIMAAAIIALVCGWVTFMGWIISIMHPTWLKIIVSVFLFCFTAAIILCITIDEKAEQDCSCRW